MNEDTAMALHEILELISECVDVQQGKMAPEDLRKHITMCREMIMAKINQP